MASEIERKIADYAAKLLTLERPESKRVKKRVLAALGKLKKELKLTLSSNVTDKIHGNKEITDKSPSEVDERNTEGTLSRKHLKGKLKLLNKELADYAQKKQLKTAIKRFSWGVRKGMEPDKHTYANLLNCYVRCGDLDGALTRFADMQKANLIPNIVVYTTLLKGYCDIGDLSGAKSLLFKEMLEKKILPGIRTVNTFIRGCTKIGAVSSALRAYYLLKEKSNISDASDDNDVIEVGKKRKAVHDDSEDDCDDEPSGDSTGRSSINNDASTKGEMGYADQCGGYSSLFESVVALLCQALIIDKASLLAIEAVSSVESFGGILRISNTDFTCIMTDDELIVLGGAVSHGQTDFSSIYVNLSKACLFTGRHGEAAKWLGCAVAALERTKSSQLRASMEQNRSGATSDKEGKRSKSINLFLSHRRAEIESEVESINSCISITKTSTSQLMDPATLEVASRTGLLNCLSRVLQFGFNGMGDYDESESKSKAKGVSLDVGLGGQLVFALRDKFGLDRVQILDPSDSTSSSSSSDTAKKTDLKKYKGKVVSKVLRSLSSETGYIDYSELFCSVGVPSDDESVDVAEDVKNRLRSLPVNLEICSGSGEWVVAHASSDLFYSQNAKSNTSSNSSGKSSAVEGSASSPLPRALWLALELRCDRVHHTISRSILESMTQHPLHLRKSGAAPSSDPASACVPFSGLSNLAVIGGDAFKILPAHIAPGSISAVYVNHPEPPERTGGIGDSEGKHLLTDSFFVQIHRVLSATGTCTIVTDNLPYAKSLLRSLANSAIRDAKSPSGNRTSFVSLTSSSTEVNNGRKLEEEIQISCDQTNHIEVNTTTSGHSSEDEDSDDDAETAHPSGDSDMMYEDEEQVRKMTTATSTSKGKEDSIKSQSDKGYTGSVLQLWRGESADATDSKDKADNAHVSSYFDRMWERGQKKRRWYIILIKQP